MRLPFVGYLTSPFRKVLDFYKSFDAQRRRENHLKLFGMGFLFGSDSANPLLLLGSAFMSTRDEGYVIQDVDAFNWLAEYTVEWYSGKRPRIDVRHMIRCKRAFNVSASGGHAYYACGYFAGRLVAKGLVSKVFAKPESSSMGVWSVLTRLFSTTVHAERTVAQTPVESSASDDAVEATTEVTESPPEAAGSVSANATHVPSMSQETDPGSIARGVSSRRKVKRPEGTHGGDTIDLPLSNVVEFLHDKDPVGWGIIARGSVATLGHVLDVSTSYRCGGDTYPIPDKTKRHLVERYNDAVVVFAHKVAKPGTRKVAMTDVANTREPIWFANDRGRNGRGSVTSRSSTAVKNGEAVVTRYTYTVSSTTAPGDSGTPVFVRNSQGNAQLLGLHWGTNHDANVVVGLLPSDFQ